MSSEQNPLSHHQAPLTTHAHRFYLAANPSIQTWLAAELHHVLGTRPRSEWDYHADFPRLKRCLAVLYETLRLKTPVWEVKWTEDRAQQLHIGGRAVTLPPQTLILPGYLHVHKHPKYWGQDAGEWRPERWIAAKKDAGEGLHAGNNEGHRYSTGSAEATSPYPDGGEKAGWEGGVEEEEVLLSPPSRGNYLGWSEGTRDCPGKRFSHVEWVAFVAAMLRDWKVEPQLQPGETFAEARTRVLDFIDKDSGYGALLLQLMHPERVPLVWSRR